MKCSDCNRKVRPVVALDIDGTMGDYHGSLFRFAADWLGLTDDAVFRWTNTYDGSERLAPFMGMTDGVYRQMKLAYRQGGGKRMMPVFPGAVDLTRSLRDNGAEIFITTTRPYNRFDSTDPDTRHWLERHHFEWDHLIYDDDKYGVLLEIVGPGRVVGVLEDIGANYDRAQELGLNPILARTRYNRAIQREVSTSNLGIAQEWLRQRIERWEAQHEH